MGGGGPPPYICVVPQRHWGGGGVSRKGLVHNLLMQFFTLGSSKIEVFKTYVFDIPTT